MIRRLRAWWRRHVEVHRSCPRCRAGWAHAHMVRVGEGGYPSPVESVLGFPKAPLGLPEIPWGTREEWDAAAATWRQREEPE